MDIKSSVEQLLDEVWNGSNSLLSLANSKAGIDLDLKTEVGTITQPLTRLQHLRDAQPATVTTVIHENAPEVGEAYEAVTDVSEMVDLDDSRELVDLAQEIRSLL
jgi:hypothetical protein